MMESGVFQPAKPWPAIQSYGATQVLADAGAATNKLFFRRGVCLMHSFLLLTIFVPPTLLLWQLAHITDVRYFLGLHWADAAYAVVLFSLVVPLLHLRMRLHPWAFLMSVWIPAFVFVAVAWHYRDGTFAVMEALQNHDCMAFAEKRPLEKAHEEAATFYRNCSDQSVFTIAECPRYEEVFKMAPTEMTYLQDLEKRFPCAGFCNSARRLWEHAGHPAPACSLFAQQWIQGGYVQARIVLWYNVFIILVAVPAMLLFDGFFKDFYLPLAK
mmetsp:Transcript_29788/g.47982  ORF Transcript_29788/g.47982 Transcript_29788/m.47982 type:complete len:270 (+) Transcript_29788:49-858(+)